MKTPLASCLDLIEDWACGCDIGQMIQDAAYFNWLNAGKPSGRDLEFWCEAERQIAGGTAEECYGWMVEIQDELRSKASSHGV